MSDFDGGAAAPADSAPVSVEPVAPVAEATNPISTEREPAPEPKADEPAKPISAREALAKAAEKVNAADKPADKAAPVQSEGATRDETGKFAPKAGDTAKPADATQATPAADPAKVAPTTATPASDAPARFSPDAKAAWVTAPEPVKAEVTRAIKEMEAGIEKHRASAEAFEPVRRFHEMAKQGGTTLDKALEAYVGMEEAIRADVDAGRVPVRGLEAVCNNFGMSLRQVAEFVLGQAPDAVASQSDATVRELKAEIAALKQQVGGVTQTFAQQRESATIEQITAFASKPEHARFDELADDIAFFLQSGKTQDLSEAYALAERLNPAPAASAPQTAAIPAPAPDLTAQTRKGSLSITGAPSPGSNPANRQPSSSIKDALRKAQVLAG